MFWHCWKPTVSYRERRKWDFETMPLGGRRTILQSGEGLLGFSLSTTVGGRRENKPMRKAFAQVMLHQQHDAPILAAIPSDEFWSIFKKGVAHGLRLAVPEPKPQIVVFTLEEPLKNGPVEDIGSGQSGFTNRLTMKQYNFRCGLCGQVSRHAVEEVENG